MPANVNLINGCRFNGRFPIPVVAARAPEDGTDLVSRRFVQVRYSVVPLVPAGMIGLGPNRNSVE